MSAEPSSPSKEDDKRCLTEQEKRNNHIASEQKRRQAIREGFDDIADLVPGLKGQGRSEAIVLQGATSYIKKLLIERHELIKSAKEKGVEVGEFMMDEQTMNIAASHAAAEQRGEGVS